MATTKQPKFPHPPLEQGVAQYPTPAIPDFITQSGHIILVEKVSAEKGSYTPRQPAVTDTNPVIYTGRDAKKWPSQLYLVHERPDETGEFVYRYWANDRTLTSQDPWNYGISYDGGDPFYPTYTREYIVPRSQYTAIPVGGQDPVFGAGQPVTLNVSGTTATITGTNFSYAKGANIYVYTQSTTTQTTQQKYALGSFTLLTASATTLTYAVQSGATNPSVPIFINPTVISEQEMAPLGEDNPLRSRYVKVKRVYEPIPSTVLTTNTNKAGLMGSTAKNDQLVTATTNPNELSLNLSGESILQSTVEHISANKSNLTNIITDGPYSLSGDSLNKFGTTETITESIVAAGTTATTSGALLLSDDITPIDITKSQRKQVVLDSVPPSLVVYESTQDNSIVQNVTSYLSRNISSGNGAFVPPVVPASQVVYSPTAATNASGYAKLTFASFPSIQVGDLVSMSGVFASGWGLPVVTATGSLNGYATLTFATLVATDVVVGDQIRISGQSSNGWAAGTYTATAVYLSTKVIVLSLPATGSSAATGYAANTSTKYAVTAITTSSPYTITLSLPVVGDATTGGAGTYNITQNNNRLLQTSDSDIGFPWVRRISKYLPTAYTSVNGYVQLPPSRTEYKTFQFSFPGLIYTWGETSTGTSATFTYPQNRLPLDITCTQKLVYTYYDYQPNVSALKFFKVVTQPWAINFFGIPKNTIHPPAPISFKNDASVDNGVTYGIFGGAASTPTTYKIGQQILIGADVQLWQGGIYVQRLIYTQEPLS
jgi:hypothetical protein